MPMNWLQRAALALCLAAAALAARAASPIVLMVGGMNKLVFLPALIAQRQGFFSEAGVQVELVSEPAGVEAEDELVAGAVQGVVGFYDHCIDLQSKGYAIESVIQLTKVPGEVLLARADTSGTTLAQIAGRRFGVTGLGSSTDYLTEYLAQRAGLARGQYRMLPVDAGDRFIDALHSGRIVAGMTTDPTVARLLRAHQARVLEDLRTEPGTSAALGGPYPAASVYMQRAWVDTHPAQVRAVVHAFLRALEYLRTHDAATVTAGLPTAFLDGHRTLYVQALDTFRPMYSTDGRMPPGGPANVLRVLATIRPDIDPTDIDLARTYTTRFLGPH